MSEGVGASFLPGYDTCCIPHAWFLSFVTLGPLSTDTSFCCPIASVPHNTVSLQAKSEQQARKRPDNTTDTAPAGSSSNQDKVATMSPAATAFLQVSNAWCKLKAKTRVLQPMDVAASSAFASRFLGDKTCIGEVR